jgi:GNAT superfamily N-acetyltransferase
MLKHLDKILDQRMLEAFKTCPNQGILWEIIEQQKTGKIFELPSKAILVMENCSDPFVWIAGDLTAEDVTEVVSLVGGLAFPMLYCKAKYHALFLQRDWNFHLRSSLSLQKRRHIISPDSTFEIKPIKSVELFKQCTWYKERSELYGSDENFLRYGIGYALCKGSSVVSEAYASSGRGYAEIGVITHPDHKRKGYATLIVSHLINECEKSQTIPQWSCNVDNRASLSTGLKMGFEIDSYYTLLVPDCGNVACKNLIDWLKNNDYPM